MDAFALDAAPVSVRFALKAATDPVHRELDDRLSRLDLAEADGYRRFLDFHARTVPAVESALDSGGLNSMVEGWRSARRSAALEADLKALGAPVPTPVAQPDVAGVAALLGTAYVLEGSRLGGRVLKRRVGAGLPVAFLSSSETRNPWPTVVAALDRLLYSESLVDEAKGAARHCFALFLSVAREVGI